MITTLTGDNWFLLQTELNRLIHRFTRENNDLSVEKVDDPTLSIDRLSQILSSQSLFSGQKLIILIEPSKNKQFFDNLSTLINNLADSTQLVIVDPILDKRSSYYKLLSKSTDFKVFNKLSQTELVKWVIDYVKKKDGTISGQQANYLINRVGDDQLLLASEIDKLSVYSNDITTSTIDLLTEESDDSTIFQLLDAAFSEKPKLALEIYNKQRQQKVEPEQILLMLCWQVQILALCLAAKNMTVSEVASASKVNPFVIQKSKQIAKKLSLSQVKILVSKLSQIDIKSKTSFIDLDEALKNFIVELSH